MLLFLGIMLIPFAALIVIVCMAISPPLVRLKSWNGLKRKMFVFFFFLPYPLQILIALLRTLLLLSLLIPGIFISKRVFYLRR